MSARLSSRKPIGVGVIGTGFGRSTQIPAFAATPGVEVVAVVSRSLARAYAAAKAFDIRRAFDESDLDRFLALEDLDLVCVSSPPSTHREYSLRALRAGKHVLCEKPMALNAQEAREMTDVARESGLLALIDHELRFDPTRRLLRDLVLEGFLGRLYHVEITVESEFRLDPAKPWSWWSDASQGGGILGAIGSHVVDSVRYTFGEVENGRAQLRTWVTERNDAEENRPRPVTADDYASCWLEIEDGAVVSCLLSGTSRPERPGWEMAAHGSDGSLLLHADGTLLGRHQGESEYRDLTPASPPFDAKALRMNDTMWSRAFILFAAEIAAALAAGHTAVPLAATFEDGLCVQQALDALRQSASHGKWAPCGSEAQPEVRTSR